jgi:hypothetical protein
VCCGARNASSPVHHGHNELRMKVPTLIPAQPGEVQQVRSGQESACATSTWT